jgi:hypothetical protein
MGRAAAHSLRKKVAAELGVGGMATPSALSHVPHAIALENIFIFTAR